jgi:hypothetical protein
MIGANASRGVWLDRHLDRPLLSLFTGACIHVVLRGLGEPVDRLRGKPMPAQREISLAARPDGAALADDLDVGQA